MGRGEHVFLIETIENLFGNNARQALEGSNSLTTWKKYTQKTIKAVAISIQQTVQHCDKEWLAEVNKTTNNGLEKLNTCKTIDDVLAVLAGTFINLSFLQIGFMPQSRSKKKISLRKNEWELSDFRSVIYLQSVKQREACFWHVQQQEMGFQRQMVLRDKYRVSHTPLQYMEWCELQAAS